MDRYDADHTPDPAAWLAIDDDERRRLVLRHHRGRVERVLHVEGYNRVLHATLHVVLENQIAEAEPPVTARAVERLQAEGLRRHAAVHAVLDVLVRRLGSRTLWDPAAWEAELGGLTAGDWLGGKMRRDLG
ncbi:MAG: DUF1841 family protein [Myxococcota bacterium]